MIFQVFDSSFKIIKNFSLRSEAVYLNLVYIRRRYICIVSYLILLFLLNKVKIKSSVAALFP